MALLAALPAAEVKAIVAESGLPRLTDRTICEPEALRAELNETRRRGYAIDDGEHAVGLRCVAATIHDDGGRPLAALSISGPAARIDDVKLKTLGGLVAGACEELTSDIGGLPGR